MTGLGGSVLAVSAAAAAAAYSLGKGSNSVLAASLLDGRDWMASPITNPADMEKVQLTALNFNFHFNFLSRNMSQLSQICLLIIKH